MALFYLKILSQISPSYIKELCFIADFLYFYTCYYFCLFIRLSSGICLFVCFPFCLKSDPSFFKFQLRSDPDTRPTSPLL